MTTVNSRSVYFLLSFILLTGFILRFYHIDHSGSWLDEKISLAESNGFTYLTPQFNQSFTTAEIKQANTIPNVVSATIKEDGGNGLLYILKLHYWQSMFGSSDTAIRMLSLLFSLLSVIVVYFAAAVFFQSQRVALFTALLLAIHPLLVDFAQEARPYSMAMFFSLCSTLFFYKAFVANNQSNHNKSYLLLYFFSCSASVMTHYLTAYIFIAQGLYFLIYVRGTNHWLYFIASWIGVILVLSVWMMNGGLEGLRYMSEHNQHYVSQLETLKEGDNPFILPANFKNIFLGWMQQLLAATGNTLQQAGFRLRVLIPLFIIPAVLFMFCYKKTSDSDKRPLLFCSLLALSGCCYATLLALIAGHTISFQPAYVLFSAPYLSMLLCYGASKLFYSESKLLRKVSVSFLLLLVITSSLYLHYSTDKLTYTKAQPNPVAALAEILPGKVNAGDTVVFSNYTEALITNIYLDSTFKNIQLIDTLINDKVIIKNTGTVIFDLENGKHRY